MNITMFFTCCRETFVLSNNACTYKLSKGYYLQRILRSLLSASLSATVSKASCLIKIRNRNILTIVVSSRDVVQPASPYDKNKQKRKRRERTTHRSLRFVKTVKSLVINCRREWILFAMLVKGVSCRAPERVGGISCGDNKYLSYISL